MRFFSEPITQIWMMINQRYQRQNVAQGLSGNRKFVRIFAQAGAPAGLNFLDAQNEKWAAAVHKKTLNYYSENMR